MFHGNFPTGITVEEGVRLLCREAPLPQEESVPLPDCDGRVLARDLLAPESVPPFARSPYDGYALRAADTVPASEQTPVTLSILEEVPAGHAPRFAVGPGQATKILTGAPIPEGADLVVMYEETTFTDQQVTLTRSYPSGKNVVPVGEDILEGQLVAKKGTLLSPATLGLLAGLGFTQLPVYRRPVVGLISTGDELVGLGEALTPGKIRNSSVYALKAYLERLGAQVQLHGIVGDDAGAIAQRVQQAAASADLVITTGGVSVGDYDLVGQAMQQLDARVLFWKVKMKPGSALLASCYQGKPVLSLSGNPASAAVSFFLLGITLLRTMAGRTDIQLPQVQVRLKEAFPKASPGRRLIPGQLEIQDGQAVLALMPKQGNGMLAPLFGCDLLGEIPAGSPALPAGSVLNAYRIF